MSKVWLRMLRSLDDINRIKDPLIHANVMSCLAEVWKMLIEVNDVEIDSIFYKSNLFFFFHLD